MCALGWAGGKGEFNRPIGVLNSARVTGRRPSLPSSPSAGASQRVLSNSQATRRSVKPTGKRWQPPEGLSPQDVQAVIAAAACERDRLLLTTLWATGARISEVLGLRPKDVRRLGLVLPNLKNPSRPVKTAYLRARPAPVRSRTSRRAGTRLPAFVPPCTRATDCPLHQELGPGAEAGWLGAPAHRIPDAQRRRGAGPDGGSPGVTAPLAVPAPPPALGLD